MGSAAMKSRYPTFHLRAASRFQENFSGSLTPTISPKNGSSVTIDLGDYLRRVSVTGESADQVEAISKSLENDLLRYSTAIRGATFRRVVGVCLSAGLLTSLGLCGTCRWRTRAHSALGMLICSAIGLLLVLLVPWHRYLPGFVLYQSYSPFLLIKYAPQIFFLSLVATLVGIPLSYFLPRWRERHHFR